MTFNGFYEGKRVIVTGDTGFKGSWLCLWLDALGATVHGIGLAPETDPALFDVLGLATRIRHRLIDIRDRAILNDYVESVNPDVVFHLAAQSLVRRSYRSPVTTLETNVIGTANVLAAVGRLPREPESPVSVVVVTSDKCYENRETGEAYHEEDPMGGHDIYSASKGAAELIVSAWRRSFWSPERRDGSPAVATCRAGNVIGGGDWAEDRLVPDIVRSLDRVEPVRIRNQRAVRPWQHVLEPLSGYLLVGSCLPDQSDAAQAWNFGPGPEGHRTVAELVETFIRRLGRGEWVTDSLEDEPHEATLLHLSVDKVRELLGWEPVWGFEACVSKTAEWYRSSARLGAELYEISMGQIRSYVRDARGQGLPWASTADAA